MAIRAVRIMDKDRYVEKNLVAFKADVPWVKKMFLGQEEFQSQLCLMLAVVSSQGKLWFTAVEVTLIWVHSWNYRDILVMGRVETIPPMDRTMEAIMGTMDKINQVWLACYIHWQDLKGEYWLKIFFLHFQVMDKIPRDTMMNPIMKIRIRAPTTSSPMAARGSRKGHPEGKEAEFISIYLRYCLVVVQS